MHRGALGAVAPPGGRYLPGSATPAEALHLAETATEAAAAAAVGRRLELKTAPETDGGGDRVQRSVGRRPHWGGGGLSRGRGGRAITLWRTRQPRGGLVGGTCPARTGCQQASAGGTTSRPSVGGRGGG